MHLIPPSEASVVRRIVSRRERTRWGDAMRGLRTEAGSRLWNYPSPAAGPAVTIPLMRAGRVGAALSVLYVPLDEMDLSCAYGSPPDADYFPRLLRQLDLVEAHVATAHGDAVRIARA